MAGERIRKLQDLDVSGSFTNREMDGSIRWDRSLSPRAPSVNIKGEKKKILSPSNASSKDTDIEGLPTRVVTAIEMGPRVESVGNKENLSSEFMEPADSTSRELSTVINVPVRTPEIGGKVLKYYYFKKCQEAGMVQR